MKAKKPINAADLMGLFYSPLVVILQKKICRRKRNSVEQVEYVSETAFSPRIDLHQTSRGFSVSSGETHHQAHSPAP